MPTPPLSDDLAREALRALQEAGGVVAEAARRLGLPRQTLVTRLEIARRRCLDWPARRRAYRGVVGGPPVPAAATPPEGFGVVRNAGAYDADGNLLRQWVQTAREGGDVYQVPAGHVVKGESTLVDPQGQVLAKWIKTREGSTAGLVGALREVFAEYDGAAPARDAPTVSDDDVLTVYPIPDLHLGMHAWGRETGDNYDTKLAVALASERIEALVEQSTSGGHAVILGLGDYFHANDHKAVTPASGNRLDVDGRWPKVYLAGATLATRIVDAVSRRHREVEVVFLPGNHDPDASVTLTVALAMFYSKVDRVSVFQEPTIAWFRRFGRCLIGATHGHTMRPEQMAMMMATDRAEEWGQTVFRHFFFGHVHHETAREVAGCRVESLSSPAPRDAWNAAAGYRSGRALSAVTFHRDLGEVGRHRVNIVSTSVRGA